MKGSILERVLQDAENYIQQGKVQHAIYLLRLMACICESPSICYQKLAELYRKQRRYSRAIWALRQAIRFADNPDPYRAALIEVLLESGRWRVAIRECRRWLRQSPDHPIPLERLMDVYWRRMEFQRALELANRLVQLLPASAHHRLRRAHLLEDMGRYAQAAEEYQRLVEDDSAPFEVMVTASLDLRRLDHQQLTVLVPLLMEDPAFRLEFLRDPVAAVRQRGFRFSPAGEEMLTDFPDEMQWMTQRTRRHGGYS